MSLQALWIIKLPSENSVKDETVLFSRFYQPYIKKCKQLEGEEYVPIPSNPEFAKAMLFELGHLDDGSEKFIRARDSCQRVEQKPVYEISTSAGKLWPIIVVEKPGLLFCCLPFVPQGVHTKPPLIHIPGVTLGFTLLCALTDVLRNAAVDEIVGKSGDIYSFLSQAAPYGTILDTTGESVLAKMAGKTSTAQKTTKQPAWKPVSHKGKNQMHLSITEFVRAVQYDRENVDDVWDVYGTVTCKAELEGAMTTVTMTISQTTEGEVTPLNHLLIHPCVQSADSQIIDDDQIRAVPRRVRFTPPLEMITLCHYTVNTPRKPPVTGSFELFAEEDRAKIKVSLQIDESIKKSFDYCELQIPFTQRGPITIQESSLNHGSLHVSPNKSILVWNIGQRLPARHTQISMSSIIQLGASKQDMVGSLEQKFCTGQNAYAQLFFKISEFTQSGCFVDAKSIQVSPNMKYKLTCVREYLAADYKFWNVHGDSIISAIPKCLSDRQTFTE